jgi:hypothetical protein
MAESIVERLRVVNQPLPFGTPHQIVIFTEPYIIMPFAGKYLNSYNQNHKGYNMYCISLLL